MTNVCNTHGNKASQGVGKKEKSSCPPEQNVIQGLIKGNIPALSKQWTGCSDPALPTAPAKSQ